MTAPENMDADAMEASGFALGGAALCETARTLDGWSRLLALATLLTWWVSPSMLDTRFSVLLIVGLVLAAGAACHALRLSFDHPVFTEWSRLDAEELPRAFSAFDGMLLKTFGKKSSGKNPRPIPARLAGVRRLLVRQLVCVAGQAVVLFAFLAMLISMTPNA